MQHHSFSTEMYQTNIIWLEQNVFASNDIASSFGSSGGSSFKMKNNLIADGNNNDNNKKVVQTDLVKLKIKEMYQKMKMKYSGSTKNKIKLF